MSRNLRNKSLDRAGNQPYPEHSFQNKRERCGQVDWRRTLGVLLVIVLTTWKFNEPRPSIEAALSIWTWCKAEDLHCIVQAAIAVALLAGIIIAALAISFHSGIIYSQWLTGEL